MFLIGCGGGGGSAQAEVDNSSAFDEVQYEQDGNHLYFSWNLKAPVDEIRFCRGSEVVATLSIMQRVGARLGRPPFVALRPAPAARAGRSGRARAGRFHRGGRA